MEQKVTSMVTYRLFLLAVGAILVAVGCSSPSPTSTPVSTPTVAKASFSDPAEGVSFQYSTNWEVKKKANELFTKGFIYAMPKTASSPPTALTFDTLPKPQNFTWSSNTQVSYEELNPRVVDFFKVFAPDDAPPFGFLTDQLEPGPPPVLWRDEQVNGQPAKRRSGSMLYEKGGNPVGFVEYVFVGQQKLYSLTCMGPSRDPKVTATPTPLPPNATPSQPYFDNVILPQCMEILSTFKHGG